MSPDPTWKISQVLRVNGFSSRFREDGESGTPPGKSHKYSGLTVSVADSERIVSPEPHMENLTSTQC